MARRSDRQWEEPGDDYTPATDLIFSIFAMTVLLLALFGAGDHVKLKNTGAMISIEKAKVDALEKENRRLKADADRHAKEFAASTKTIDDLRREIGVLRLRPPAPLPVPTKPQKPDKPTVADLQARLADLQARLEETLNIAEEYRKRLEVLQAKIDFTQIRIGDVDEASVGPFMADESRFSTAVRDRLLDAVAARADDIATVRGNRLLFEISTSPTLGVAADGTDRDMMEAMIWGEALMRAMRPTALPVGCLAVLPTGKLHSTHLHGLAIRPGAGKAVDDFERLLRLKQLPMPIRSEIEATRGLDRHITVWAQSVAGETCDPSVLAAATRSLAAGRR